MVRVNSSYHCSMRASYLASCPIEATLHLSRPRTLSKSIKRHERIITKARHTPSRTLRILTSYLEKDFKPAAAQMSGSLWPTVSGLAGERPPVPSVGTGPEDQAQPPPSAEPLPRPKDIYAAIHAHVMAIVKSSKEEDYGWEDQTDVSKCI